MALLGRLPPVHAPAGFVDRVMGEAYRPPWPRRLLDVLFRPLRVKLPLEAAAVLLVGVSALYVYQHAPEVPEVARQETPDAVRGSRRQPPAPLPRGRPGTRRVAKDRGHQAKRAPAEQETAREQDRSARLAPPRHRRRRRSRQRPPRREERPGGAADKDRREASASAGAGDRGDA